MTPKERAAMQQALEAIGDCSPNKALVKAAYALREALAKQAEQEPVACAKVCEQDEFQIYETAERCTAAIRARGE